MPEKEEEKEHFVTINIIPGSQRHYTRRYGRWWDQDKPWLWVVESVAAIVLAILVVLVLSVLIVFIA